MRRVILAIALVVAFPLAATAADCVQSDGQPGVQLVGIEGDAGCQTADEYAAVFSVDNLIAEGVYTEATDNGDGTFTVSFATGAVKTVATDPLNRPVAASSSEPDAPTVREVLYSRPAFGVQPI